VASAIDPYEDHDWADRCSSVEEWGNVLGELIADPFALEERRMRLEAIEEAMWQERRAALTGEALVRRVTSLLE
jgi:hypothetical protein